MLICLKYMNIFFFEIEVCKVLFKILKEKVCEELEEWIKLCVKYFYWSVILIFSGNGRVIWVKFRFFLSYVVNRYNGLEDLLFKMIVYFYIGMYCR